MGTKYGLNDEQWATIVAKSPTVVNATAGSGKTRCLVSKIRNLIENGVDPKNICSITFTNKAAKEMKDRLKTFGLNVKEMQISTIHSMCVRIIKEFIGYTRLKSPFSIYDDNDQRSIVKTIVKARGLKIDPYVALSGISRAKSEQEEDNLEDELAFVYKLYQEILAKNNACDFDDLLIFAHDCLKHGDCREYYKDIWHHVLVDEMQDTSKIQYEIVISFFEANRTKTMFCVGDLNQCVIEGTKITKNGISCNIEEIDKGDKILSGSGNTFVNNNLVTRAFSRRVENLPVITLETMSGKRLTTTYEHSHFAGYSRNTEKLLNDLNLNIDKPHHISKCVNKRRRRNFIINLCGSERRINENKDHKFTNCKNISHMFYLSGSDVSDEEKLKKLGILTRKAKNGRGYRIDSIRSNLDDIYKIAEKIQKVLPINIIQKGRFTHRSLPVIPASNLLPGMECFVEDKGKIKIELIKKIERSVYSGKIYDLNIDKVHNYVANGIVTHNSIYAFRGAHPENMLNFIEEHKATVCNLTYNYRSCSSVIDLANKFQYYGEPMIAKTANVGRVSASAFYSQEDEANKIADALLKMGNYEDTAVLYRVNTRSLLFEKTFAMNRIPYKVVGALPFYKRKVAKDMLAYLKAANNLSDLESLARIVNVPKRGFGAVKKEALLREGRGYLDKIGEELPLVKNFIDLLKDIKGKKPLEAINDILNRTDYRGISNKEKDANMIDAMLNVAAGFDTPEELILASTFLEEDTGNGVKLMTAHASKGLEFNRVFVVGVEEDLWPHKNSSDTIEEKRLFYVSTTRAKKYLNISYSRSRTYRGVPLQVLPSPLFIETCKILKASQ